MSDYAAFLEQKRLKVEPVGFDVTDADLAMALPFEPFQRDIVRLATKLGRFCVWADCGLGKSPMQLKWADLVCQRTGGRVLILAPLAVSHQTVREAQKFGIDGVEFAAHPSDTTARIVVTNYQKLSHFNAADFTGVVLDESSILKAVDGRTRTEILTAFAETPYRLACSATPAPNDYMELGNHAEFVGVMTREEMLAMFFTHDGGETSQWRLKGHAAARFWEWVCTWAVTIRKPSDLGYDDGAFRLPPLTMVDHVVHTPIEALTDEHGQRGLFAHQALTLGDQRAVQRDSLELRVADAVTLANQPGQWLVWCHLNDESSALAAQIDGAVEVTGSDSDDYKQLAALWFSGQKCLCDEFLFRDKLEAWRSVNARILNTCASITAHTSKTGTNALLNGVQPTTPSAENDTEQIARSEKTLSLKSGNTTAARSTSRDGSNSVSSGSLHQITRPCSTSREVYAPSVNRNALEINAIPIYISTIAMPRDPLGGSCAHPAILDSVNLEMMPIDSFEPRCICGHMSGRRVLVSKAAIFGWGMNFQTCHQVVFVGLSHSYESFYQAIRRCWRFGQQHEVSAHVVYDWAEGAVVENLRRKEIEAAEMAERMVEVMRENTMEQLQRVQRQVAPYSEHLTEGEGWRAYLGDCVEGVARLDADSIHYSIFSPPFASLYTYSNSDRDMGNSRDGDFERHFQFLVRELHRVLMPGRLVSFHCMNLPMSKQHHGVIGLRDFRGDLIRMFENAGFVFHSEVCIWKDPVTAMQRTKAIGLLHKQIVKDSAMSRQGVPDYLVTMRKRGDNPEPVAGKLTTFVGEHGPRPSRDETRDSINIWQRYASPVWMDINPSDTLQFRHARDNDDERHICPLQLDVIRRGLQLWSNPGDVVLSPFMGIGSEGYVALEMGRAFVGFELKQSYYDVAVKNLDAATKLQAGLFAAEATA